MVFIVTAALPLVSNRHYPLFALTLVVVAGEHIADVCNRWSRPGWSRLGQSRLIASVSIVVALVMVGLSIRHWGCIRIEPFYFGFPARAVALLKQNEIRGNMAVPFDWGEYVLWHVGPAVKVSIDGRRETIYSDEAYEQSRHFEQGTGVWNALLKTSNTDVVMAHNGSATANLMACSDGWVPVYQDTFCVIFIRGDFPGLAQIAEQPGPTLPDNGNGLCFPAPGPS